jgi:hypothetical protein
MSREDTLDAVRTIGNITRAIGEAKGELEALREEVKYLREQNRQLIAALTARTSERPAAPGEKAR